MTLVPLWIFAILFLGRFMTIIIADSAVSVSVNGYTDSNGNYACNSSVILTCKITNYKSMTWTIKDEVKSRCIFGTCYNYPPIPDEYNFTTDTTNGNFHITINPLRLTDRGIQFICSDGSILSEVYLNITAENDDFNITYTDESSGSLSATTGCFRSDTEVEFIWKKIQVNVTSSTTIYKSGKGESLPCVSACLESGRIQRKSLLYIEEDKSGDLFMFQVEIIYLNESHRNEVYNFSRLYTLGGSPCEDSCDIVCILLFVYGALLVLVVIVGCLLLYVMLRTTGEEANTEDKWPALEILLNTLSAILWIVIASLYTWSLLDCCSCDDTCDCDDFVLSLRFVFGSVAGINLVLWCILRFNTKKQAGNEDAIYFKTKLEKVRIIFSNIPFVGFFSLLGCLIRICCCCCCCCCENSTIHDEQMTIEEKKHQLPSNIEPNLENLKTEETGKQNSNTDRRKWKKEQDKLHKFVDKNISLSEKADQLSASDVIIVKPSGTDKVKHSRSSKSGENSTKRKLKADSEVKTNKKKSQKENSAFTNSGTKQLSQNNGSVITSSQEHNIKNVLDSQNLVSYSEEMSQRKMDVTEMNTESENNSGSKDDVKREKKKSRKSDDVNKHPLNTNMVSSEAHTGTMELTETKSGSENKLGGKDDVKREKRKSRKSGDENKNPQNTNTVSAEAHTWNIDVKTIGSKDKLGSSDNNNPSNSSMSGKALPRRKESRKETDDNKNPRNTKPGSADSHNGSETMKRALSANFHDEEDATTTVSIDSSTKM